VHDEPLVFCVRNGTHEELKKVGLEEWCE
jgi:hypothetical protein